MAQSDDRSVVTIRGHAVPDSARDIGWEMDLGINWIDTAAGYGLGHSEEVVGQALTGMAERPYVFTKCGLPWNERGEIIVEDEGRGVLRILFAAGALVPRTEVACGIVGGLVFGRGVLSLALPWPVCPMRRNQDPFPGQGIKPPVRVLSWIESGHH